MTVSDPVGVQKAAQAPVKGIPGPAGDGLPLIGRADWNDCLNLNCFSAEPGERFQSFGPSEGPVAESVFIAGMFVKYGGAYAELCDRIGLSEEAESIRRAVGFPRTAMKWPVTPEVLDWGARFLCERYGLPCFITENGLSCNDALEEFDSQVQHFQLTRKNMQDFQNVQFIGPVSYYNKVSCIR